MSKHPKQKRPTDKDLEWNPMIGGAKGATGMSAEELEASEGSNTVEGDVENDTNPQGGIDKSTARSGRSRP
jgi:hypothetical protein